MFLLCWFFHFVTVISTILKDEREMSVQCHMSSIVNYIEKKIKKRIPNIFNTNLPKSLESTDS